MNYKELNIPEISGTTASKVTAGSSKTSSTKVSFENYKTQVEFINPPVFTWTCVDHDENCTTVYVAVAMISDATDIKFEIAENGKYVTVEYVWPVALFKAHELFAEEIKGNKGINSSHPKLHSMMTELLNSGITQNSYPKGSIIIQLPICVQKEIGTWKKNAVKKEDGTRIALLEFKGFMQQQHIEEADTSISFD